MSRKLIIEGNAIYEIDEECMLKQKLEEQKAGVQREKRDDTTREHAINRIS